MQNESIMMRRQNLAAIPRHPVPKECFLRWYQPGDCRAWIDLHRAADKYNTASSRLYEQQFRADAYELSQRQCFLCRSNGQVIGTATAWYDDKFGDTSCGRVHWVAIHPDEQGRGYSKTLLTAVLARLRELGAEWAYLVTSTARVPAVNLYAGFAFEPYMLTPAEEEIWQEFRRTATGLRL